MHAVRIIIVNEPEKFERLDRIQPRATVLIHFHARRDAPGLNGWRDFVLVFVSAQ